MRSLTWLALIATTPAFAQTSGIEFALATGHADRGFIIADRPVIQPVVWLTTLGTALSAWSSFNLAENTDGARPQILELEGSHAFAWNRFSIAPALRMYFYRDPVSPYSTRSVEGWLYLTYDTGPLEIYSHQNLDVLTYPGAYYGEAGISSEWELASRTTLGASVGAGWANTSFNEAWAEVSQSGLGRIAAQATLTTYFTPHFYIAPQLDFSHLTNRDVRDALLKPTYVLVRLMMGGEF